jgi:hypothetical protein
MNPGVSSSAAYVDSRAARLVQSLKGSSRTCLGSATGIHPHPPTSRCLQVRQRLHHAKYPAGGAGSSRPYPEIPATSRPKRLLSLESPPIPGQPGTAMTDLSRRRSRVRVPSLPFRKVAANRCCLLPVSAQPAIGPRILHTARQAAAGGSRRQPVRAACSRSRPVGAGRCAPAEKPEVMTSQAALRRDWDRDQPGALLTPTWLRAANGTRDRNHSPALAVDDRLVRLAQPE